ncbi:MAG: hypothetical protein ACC726_12520, partial [Chloroflexota bacterium]
APYSATDFALCFLCHSEAPFRDVSGDARNDTNFRFHGVHLTELAGMGNAGTDIDTPGAGGGNAICAECHFRTHSTAYKVGGQDTYRRLVNFAPNVLGPNGGSLPANAWDQSQSACFLNCHGERHNPEKY